MAHLTADQQALQQAINELCTKFDQAYWTEVDGVGRYPQEFVDELSRGGWLSLLIPEEYGGGGGTIADAALVLETLERDGCATSAAHAQMYTMGTVLRHGSDEQKLQYLPRIAAGELRLQSFGVTEPDAGHVWHGARRVRRQRTGGQLGRPAAGQQCEAADEARKGTAPQRHPRSVGKRRAAAAAAHCRMARVSSCFPRRRSP